VELGNRNWDLSVMQETAPCAFPSAAGCPLVLLLNQKQCDHGLLMHITQVSSGSGAASFCATIGVSELIRVRLTHEISSLRTSCC